MKQLFSKKWWIAAGIRAVKTCAQTAVGIIGTAAVIAAVDWKMCLSATILSGATSLLTSLAGLPEVDDKDESDEGEKE